MHKKTKGAIAEMAVASELMKKGWSILFPFGENHRYDLVAENRGKFVRVQVKYVTPKGGKLQVSCKSSNNWTVDKYTPKQIDVIAAYDAKTKEVYFIPSSKFNSSAIQIRLEPARNNQKLRIRRTNELKLF